MIGLPVQGRCLGCGPTLSRRRGPRRSFGGIRNRREPAQRPRHGFPGACRRSPGPLSGPEAQMLARRPRPSPWAAHRLTLTSQAGAASPVEPPVAYQAPEAARGLTGGGGGGGGV